MTEVRSSLSDSFVYVNKPRAAPATKSRVHIYPVNGSSGFSPGNTIKFVLPTGNGGEYLNCRQSYLKFELHNLDETDTNKVVLDYSAHALIRALKVSASGGAGGGVLEIIEEYNALYHTLLDLSGSTNHMSFAGSVAEGFGEDVEGGSSQVVCIPLMSSIVGSMQSKYLPVGNMARTHLTLELTLGDQEKVQHNNFQWVLKNVEYVAEMIHLAPDVDRAIFEANGGRLIIPYTTYSQHRWIASNGYGSMTMAFSSPYKALKTLIAIFRKDADNYNTKKYVSTRNNPIGNGGRYHFTINGVLTPSKPVDSNPEAWAEAQKAFHAYGCQEHMGIVNSDTWTANEGKYLIATDLESQSHKSMFSENGVNVSTSVSHLTAQFESQLSSSLTVDVFSHYGGYIKVGVDGLVGVFV
jgi:hypothetical protein